ncbi:DUF2141 domain-containing protein [Desulfurivibrio sp. D14AmB]|uniref:DUF2141 domain-containing protein n=1 Tax=Desulfurivibrio sp. D14AmB TaxID=3374370 RepID=UPI00376EFC68
MRFLLACATILLLAAQAQASELTVKVTKVESAEGGVYVALYGLEDGFPSRPCRWCQRVPAQPGTVAVLFPHLPPGRYAVSVYHDVNGNGRLDTNRFGVPTEPYGFSLDARGSFGPPSFEDASFTVADQPLALEINLVSNPPAPEPEPEPNF